MPTISIEYGTAAQANTLDYRGNLPALSTISAYSGSTYPQIRISQTLNSQITAYVTDISFSQTTYNGGPTFIVTQNPGIFGFEAGTYASSITYPYKLYFGGGESNTLAFRISATGTECASGAQVGTIYLTLSSQALSSNGSVLSAVSVNNTNYIASIGTTVYCTPTRFPSDLGTYICQQEFARMQQYLG